MYVFSRPIQQLAISIGFLAVLGILLSTHSESLAVAKDKSAAVAKDDKAATDAGKSGKPKGATAEGAVNSERHVYMRVQRDEQKKPLALQTAVVHFLPTRREKRGPAVDLIGAVHVGEESYYKTLNDKFQQYDVVLYELVAPEGTRIPKGGRGGGGGVIGGLQNGMKSVLGLSHQLNRIDYTAKNLVHADMTPEEFSKAMEDRGESWVQMYFKTLGYSMATQSGGAGGGDFSLLMALFSSDRERQLKIILAQQFEQSEGMIGALEGPDGSAIITARNGKAFDVLKREIANGHKKIGVFYGAGHLHDMEQRLVRDFGLKRSGVSWIDAWKLNPAK